MFLVRFLYCFFCLLIGFPLFIQSQNVDEQSVVTIIGDEPEEIVETNDFIKTTVKNIDNSPAANAKIANDNQPVITSNATDDVQLRFENNGYMRPAERLGGSAYASYSSFKETDYFDREDKSPKHSTSISEIKFNIKKRLRAWLPKRKKKYRPTLCGRF